jgi:hypothetical protein
MSVTVAVLAGLLVAVGVTVMVAQLLPAPPPDLRSAIERLNAPLLDPATVGRSERAARASLGMVPASWVAALRRSQFVRVPHTDLALLGENVDTFVATKISFGLMGLVMVPLGDVAATLSGLSLPWTVPVAGSLVIGLICFFLPDLSVRSRGAAARTVFVKVLYRYIYQVALQRRGSIGVLQALNDAAALGDSWVIARIRRVLLHADHANTAPWPALEQLAAQIGVPQLADAAATLRSASTENIAAYDRLIAQADALRDDIRTREHALANARSERLVIPVTVLAVVIVVIMTYPMLLRLP